LGERERLSSISPEAQALLGEVRAAAATLSSLLAHRARFDKAVMAAVEDTLQDVQQRLERSELAVVVVGEKGVGRSTFLDALLGDRVFGPGADSSALTFIRRADVASYRAHLASGALEDFANSESATAIDLAARLGASDEAIAEAEAARERARADVASAARVVDETERALAGPRGGFDAQRVEATRVAEAARAADREAERIASEAAEQERRLPAFVRKDPPAWAFWLWLFRAVALLFLGRRVRAYRALVQEREASRERTAALQLTESASAEKLARAEAELAPFEKPARAARAILAGAKRVLEAAEKRTAHLVEGTGAARRELAEHQAERQRRFVERVRALRARAARRDEVVELEIDYPARFLPDDVTIIDAPGVTSEDAEVRARAWRVIRARADGCILLSELKRGVSGPTKAFLVQVREVVPHILLVMTKMDQAFIEAVHKAEGEPYEAVEKARRIGTRRFAREVGRDPSTVLSVAVAAEPVLRPGEPTGLARRFAAESAKIFQLLRHERALILGSRSGGFVRRCIAGTIEAQERAERAYEERIARLEARRAPDPDRFREEQLGRARPAMAQRAADLTRQALDVVHSDMAALGERCLGRLRACSRVTELAALLGWLDESVREGLDAVEREVHVQLEAKTEAAAQEIEADVFEQLRVRYEIVHRVARSSSSAIQLASRDEAGDRAAAALVQRVSAAVTAFRRARVAIGLVGAAVGAAIGTAWMPGLGTAAGAALGALAAVATPFGPTRRWSVEAVEATLRARESAIAERLRSSEAVIVAALSARLERSTDQAIVRYERWIAEPIEEERAAIAEERARLGDLQRLRSALEEHDTRLEARMKAAADASLGLCR
jgi:golgin subfamily B member 1